jgi:thymidylate synthase
MNIKLCVCVDKKGGISKDGEIPWDIKEDMGFFLDTINKQSINKKVLVCGRNTYEKIKNIKDVSFLIITRSNITNTNNITTLDNLDNLKDILTNKYSNYDIFILGGKNIYEYAFYKLHNIDFHISIIDHDYKCDNYINNFNMFYEIYISDLPSKQFLVKDLKSSQYVNITFYSNSFNNNTNKNSEQAYLNLLEDILINGERRNTRNGYTRSMFGKTLEFDLSTFPLLTTKKMFMKGIFEELMFFIRGKTDSNELSEKGIKIWEGNTSREFLDNIGFNDRQVGDMGPMYGFQWRHFNASYTNPQDDYTNKGFDQLQYCINLLKTDPTSRRIIMTTYNPVQAFEGVLFPCHGITIMFYCNLLDENTYKLDLMMTQRSCDLFLGVPFNIASYALFVYLICDHVNSSDSKYKYIPGRLIMNLGDVHIYEEHTTQAIRQILRSPLDSPSLSINRKITDLEDYKFEDIVIENYNSYAGIIAKMIA